MTEISFPMPVSRELYPPLDQPSRTYGGSRALFREAAGQFDVNLDAREDDDWRALLGGAYLVDHLLDVEKVDIIPPLTSIINGDLNEELDLGTQIMFRNYMVGLEHSQYEQVLRQINTASSLAIEQRLVNTAHEVIDIRLEEAEILASLLSLKRRGGPDDQARQRFNNWLRGWSRAGYTVDSFADIRMDYENGDSGLEPTPSARLALGRAALVEATVAARKTPPKLLGKCALVAIRYIGLGKKVEVAQST